MRVLHPGYYQIDDGSDPIEAHEERVKDSIATAAYVIIGRMQERGMPLIIRINDDAPDIFICDFGGYTGIGETGYEAVLAAYKVWRDRIDA